MKRRPPYDPRRGLFKKLVRDMRPAPDLPRFIIPDAPEGELYPREAGPAQFLYPSSVVLDPPKVDEAPPITPDQDDFVRNLANQIARENGKIQWNPYVFPTPWSQDFDQLGLNVIATSSQRSRVVRFQIPRGYVGVLTHYGTDIPSSLQTLCRVFPTIDGRTMKTIDEQTHVTHPVTATTTVPGVRYPMGTLLKPRKTFHGLESEMFCGIDMELDAGADPQLPATFRAVVRGRYWPVDLATRFWAYLKSD